MSESVGGPVGAVLLGNSRVCVSVGKEQVVVTTLSTMDLRTLATCAESGRGIVGVLGVAISIDWVSTGGAGVGIGART